LSWDTVPLRDVPRRPAMHALVFDVAIKDPTQGEQFLTVVPE
jgi:hypothetical protein